MSEYRLSMEAERDVDEMYRRGFWLFGELHADKFYNQLFDTLELLASFPLSGRTAEDIYPSREGRWCPGQESNLRPAP